MPRAAPAPNVATYFDHATTSPLRPGVVEGLSELLAIPQADPARQFDDALQLRDLIEDARSSVALLGGVETRRVTFMGSIAEAALTAFASSVKAGGIILISAAERLSLLEHAARCAPLQALSLDDHGRIDLDALADSAAAYPGSVIVAQHANHEIGVVNDLQTISVIAHAHGCTLICDETLTFGRDLPRPEGAHFRIVAAELLGGPLGTVALIDLGEPRIVSQLVGGAQERGRRAGLENLMGIVGFGLACQPLLDTASVRAEARRQRRFIEHIDATVEASGLLHRVTPVNGSTLDYLVSYVSPGFEASAVAMSLNRKGIAVHAGSACSGEDPLPSSTHQALGFDGLRSLRISVGWSSSDEDLTRLAAALPEVTRELTALRKTAN